MPEDDRHSLAQDLDLISSPEERARREAANGLVLYDAVDLFANQLSLLLHLQRITLVGMSAYAGNFRPAGIEISESKHVPPGAPGPRKSRGNVRLEAVLLIRLVNSIWLDLMPYYKALEAADESERKGQASLTEMEDYLGDLFANQLSSVHDTATGSRPVNQIS